MPDRTRARYRAALQTILDGAQDPMEIARQALIYKRTAPTTSMVGEVYGELEVIFDAGLHERKEGRRNGKQGRTRRQWLCMCSCGNLCLKNTTTLKNGHGRSCGCSRMAQSKVNLDRRKIAYAGHPSLQPEGQANEIRGLQKAGCGGQAQVLGRTPQGVNAAA